MIDSGVMLTPVAGVERVVELAQLAERLGYTKVWIPDEGLATRDVFVTMTAVAMATDRIQIGTGIINPYSRHPAISALALASIDELSGGRCFLGYGSGGSLTLNPLGIARPRPRIHVREAIEVSRRLFAGERVDLDGESMTLNGAHLEFGRDDIEIWFAGRGPRMLEQAGEIADGVLLEFLHKPSLEDYVATVRCGALKSQNNPTLCYSTMIITNPVRIEELRPHMTYRLVDSQPNVKEMLGMSPAQSEQIASAMSQGLDAAAKFVPDEWIEPFVIMGSVQECASELSEVMESHGFDEFMLVVTDMDEAHELLAEAAEVVAAT